MQPIPFAVEPPVIYRPPKPSRQAILQSKARIFVGQLEPYVTEQDLYPVFSCYGNVLYLNVVRHSTTVTPNEERRIPTAFVWYATTEEADAAIAALHNKFSFTAPDGQETRQRFIQVSYADKSPEVTAWGQWQKSTAEAMRRASGTSEKRTSASTADLTDSRGELRCARLEDMNSPPSPPLEEGDEEGEE